jgi:PucR-like helix-turn-helix protein
VDQLSAVAVEGYHEAEAESRSKVADTHEQSRSRLTRAILAPEPVADEWLHALADTAGWSIPDRIVTIVVERRGAQDRLRDVSEHREALVDLDGMPCVVLPDPGADRQVVTDLIDGRRAAVGPAVRPADGNRSFVLARRMLALVQSGAVPAGRIAWCRDHLATLLLLADPLLTDQLREQTETAFADLTPKQRDRMATTLLVWLQTRGTHREIAARLDVHPQTVRYRIHQLQQLFGDKLTDPDTRLTMELALRAHLLLTPPTPG